MSKSKFVEYETAKSQDYYHHSFRWPNQGLIAYLAKIKVGNDIDYRTPFAGKETPVETVLHEWSMIFNQFKWNGKFKSLFKFEMDMRSKVGPLSIQKPVADRIDDIESYYSAINLPSTELELEAVEATKQYFKSIANCRLRSQNTVVKQMTLSTNSGSPFFTKRRNILVNTMPFTIIYTLNSDNEVHIVQSLSSGKYYVCAVLGWRGQEHGPSEEDTKQRTVWMFPLSVNISEHQVYQVLIQACQNSGLVPAWISNDAVDNAITKLFDSKGKNDLIMCTDFTKFDQHFNPHMSAVAHDLIKYLFPDPLVEGWLQNIFPIKYNIPLCIQPNTFRFGLHGMASGSGGTNTDETLVHKCLQFEAALNQHQVLNQFSQCLGDDGILSYPKLDPDKVVKSYARHGQDMNIEKQEYSVDNCLYLRRWHHNDYRVNGVCVGVYSTFRALGRLCRQERYYDPDVWSNKMVALRQLSILENVKWHPLREKFADFCIERDKYRLGLDIPGFLDNLKSLAQESITLVHDFIGYNQSQMSESGVSGINDWWIVRYLKSKR